MKAVFWTTLLTLVILNIVHCSDFKDPGQRKLEIMERLQKASSDGIISFTVEEYK